MLTTFQLTHTLMSVDLPTLIKGDICVQIEINITKI
jgi:hypothetical protein